MYEQPSQPQQSPFEVPYVPYTPPTPPTNERKGLKRAGVILLVFIALAAGGVSAFALVVNASLRDELANEKNTSQALQDENKQLKNGQGDGAAMITETLPDGRKMSYPDTEANRNVLWWSASPDANEGRDVIELSHKGFQQFLATVDPNVVASVCGTDDNVKAQKYNITIGTFDTATKELGDSGSVSCITMLTLQDNPDEQSRVEAQKVLDKALADTKQFTESVTIE